MPKRIFIRDGGLTASNPTPTGYTVIGADGGIPKKQIISTISNLGGNQFQYEIGQHVPSQGGVIAHRWLSTSAGGSPTAGTVQNYLVVAIQDAASVTWDNNPSPSALGCTSTWNGSSNFTILNSGTGTQFTSAAYIITFWGAATGLSGWYLPAIDELNKVWDNRWEIAQGISNAGGNQFTLNYYWSSTEYDSDNAWRFFFSSGYAVNAYKGDTYYVRAVRKFTI